MITPLVALAALALALGQEPAPQVPPTGGRGPGPLRLFLDCPPFICDVDFLRTEITFVDYMRDRHDAQVYLLVTSEATGGGGNEYTLTFIGLGDFAGRTDTLRYHSTSDDVSHQIRRGLARMIKLGLARYAAGTPLGEHLDLTFDAPPAGSLGQAAHDPWNYWVFTIGANGFFQGQQATTSRSLSGRMQANRTTDRWKINLRVNANAQHNFYRLDSASTYVSDNDSYNGNALVVRSLGAHWSTGAQLSLSSSTFSNTAFKVRGGPALEYDVYRYDESTRRLLTLNYFIGGEAVTYNDTTIFDRTSEQHPVHALSLSVSATQPWGNLSGSVTASQYLHDLSKRNVNFFGGATLRVVRGLSVSFFGNYTIVRDQLFLPKAGATQQQILAQQQQLATNYSYFLSVGASYTFGSIHNNVVNPRFGGGGGVFFFSN